MTEDQLQILISDGDIMPLIIDAKTANECTDFSGLVRYSSVFCLTVNGLFYSFSNQLENFRRNPIGSLC